MRVVVAGATGCVGRRLVPALLAAGHEVLVLTRDPSGPAARALTDREGVEAVACDLLDGEGLELGTAEAAYYLVHSLGSGGDYAERDRRAAETFADAVSAAGVDRVVYLGGLGPEDRLAGHLASRRAVEDHLARPAYRLVSLRAAIVIGPDSQGFRLVCQCARLGVVPAPRAIRTPCQPIALRDAVCYLIGALELPAEGAVTAYDVGGPTVLGYDDLLRRTAAAMDRRLWIRPVPGVPLSLAARALTLVSDVPAGVVGPLVRSLPVPAVADARVREYLDFALTPLADAIEGALIDSEGPTTPPETTPVPPGRCRPADRPR